MLTAVARCVPMLRSSETAVVCPERTWRLAVHLLGKQAQLAARDLRNLPRYVLRTLIGVAVVCGLLSLWGLFGDGTLPAMSPRSDFDPYRISSARCIADETSAEARWRGLSPVLAILDRVNPPVANWVRDKHRRGLIVFLHNSRVKGDSGTALAKYDVFHGRVAISPELFCESDGLIAVTLCHEYRHSRQNLGKYCQYVLSFLFVRGGNLSIIENDAVIYEQEAHSAIFGSGRSREKEAAAWAASVQQQHQARKPPLSASVVAKGDRLP